MLDSCVPNYQAKSDKNNIYRQTLWLPGNFQLFIICCIHKNALNKMFILRYTFKMCQTFFSLSLNCLTQHNLCSPPNSHSNWHSSSSLWNDYIYTLSYLRSFLFMDTNISHYGWGTPLIASELKLVDGLVRLHCCECCLGSVTSLSKQEQDRFYMFPKGWPWDKWW